jgi:hypothetical protein
VVADLIRALLAALVAGVAPGYFWAAVLRPAGGLAERLTYSAVLSMASVPVIAVLIARATGAGVTLWVALVAVGVIFGTGLLAFLVRGAAPGAASPVLPSPGAVRDPRVLTLIAVMFALALATMLHLPAPGWLLLLIAAGLILAGALAARSAPLTGEDGTAAASGGRPAAPAGGAGSVLPGNAHPKNAPPGSGPAGAAPHAAGTEPSGTTGPGTTGPGTTGPGTTGPGTTGLTGRRGRPAGSAPASAGTLMVPTGSAASASAASTSASGTSASAPGISASAEPARRPGAASSGRPARPGLRDGALALVLALTAYRAYSGVIRHDWPFLRGSDQFSHAVMAEQMLAHGSYGSYLIYPPGFPAFTAVICRLCGLTPLELFPVLAPALLVLCALGAFALASGLWGWPYGVAAAALNGLVLNGAYAGFAEGRYPDLVAAFFLLVMVVAALITLYQSPTLRSGALVAVIAASVVLYHSVATLYAAVLLALVAVTALPYLFYKRERHTARVLLLALGAGTALAVCYAALTYNLAGLVTGHSSTSTAVSLTLGSQAAPSARHLLVALSPALVWLGLFGVGAVAIGIRYLGRPAQVVAAATVLLWCAAMYVGSRTAANGFPQRFERDLGAPLSVVAAFGVMLIVRALLAQRATARTALTVSAATAAVVVAAVVMVQAARGLATGSGAAGQVLTHRVAAAGRWLGQHNTGGNIISTPYMNPGITNRAVLAMGGYTGLQSYGAFRIAHPRSLPTAGRQPLLDSQQVLLHPGSCQSAGILVRDDVRYVVLYRFGQGADLPAFAADPSRYRRVFQNASVIIYAAAHLPCLAS